MNKSIKNIKLFSVRPEDVKSIQMEWRWIQEHLEVVYLFFKMLCALVALLIVLTGQDEITAKMVADVGLLVVAWLSLSFGIALAVRYLITRGLEAAVETTHTPEPLKSPEPDRLTHYLALKHRLHERHEEDFWWDSEEDEFPSNSIQIELELSRLVYKKVKGLAEVKGFPFGVIVEDLLVAGLVDNELNTIALKSNWEAKEPIDGGLPWT